MALVRYSVLRLGLFGVCLVLLLWAGMGSWLAIVAAAFLAWGLSYVLLAGPRDDAALFLAARAQSRADRRGLSVHQREDADAEDSAVDSAERDARGGEASRGDEAVRGGEAARGDEAVRDEQD